MTKRICITILLLSVNVFAQHVHPEFGLTMAGSIFNITDTFAVGDNLPNCTGAASCFHDIANSPSNLVGSAAAPDGSLVLFEDSSHNQYSYDPTSGSFTSQPQYGANIGKLVIGDSTSIWALSRNQGACSQYGPNFFPIYKWNDSNAWVQYNPGSCATDIAADSQGNGYVIGGAANNTIFVSNGTGWVQVSGTLPGAASGVTVDAGGIRVAVTSGGQVYAAEYSSGAWGAWKAIGSNIGASTVTVVPDFNTGDLAYYATVNVRGQLTTEVYTGGQWNALTGSTVASGSFGFAGLLYVVDGLTGLAAQYSPSSILWTHGFQEKTTCTPSPCPATQHQYHTAMTMGGRTVMGYSSGTADKTGVLSATASFDPFEPVQPGDGTFDGANCPVAGNNFVSFQGLRIPWDWHLKIANTKDARNQLPPYNCSVDSQGVRRCNYPVVQWCGNTNTPLFDPISIRDDQSYQQWDSLGFCWVSPNLHASGCWPQGISIPDFSNALGDCTPRP